MLISLSRIFSVLLGVPYIAAFFPQFSLDQGIVSIVFFLSAGLSLLLLPLISSSMINDKFIVRWLGLFLGVLGIISISIFIIGDVLGGVLLRYLLLRIFAIIVLIVGLYRFLLVNKNIKR